MLVGASSTTRMRAGRSMLRTSSAALAVLADLLGQLADRDWFYQVAVEPGAQNPLAIASHRLGRDRDDGDRGGVRRIAQAAEGGDAVHVRQLDVHQDEGRPFGRGQAN